MLSDFTAAAHSARQFGTKLNHFSQDAKNKCQFLPFLQKNDASEWAGLRVLRSWGAERSRSPQQWLNRFLGYGYY